MLKNVIEMYQLPREVQFCRRCVISNQRPRIAFDDEGVCSACRFAEQKKTTIQWSQRHEELLELCDRYRKLDGSYDVIVPCSGGKDSGFVAHQLKHVYGMNPLTVTWAPHQITNIGLKNWRALIHSGFDNVLGTANTKIHRRLTHLAFRELGEPFQPFIYGQKAFPMWKALMFQIPLIMYGENGEVEYGGDGKNANNPSHNIEDDLTKHYFSGYPVEKWKDFGLTDNDLNFYKIPPKSELKSLKIECHFFSYYKKWVPQDNYYYCVENTGFQANPDGRSEGTYSKYASLDDCFDGFHYYMGYIKFGLGRATSDAAHEIRDDHITREEGVSLVNQYDGEFPEKYFKDFLEYSEMTQLQFEEIVESFRSEHLWEKKMGAWKLRKRLI